VSWVDSINTKVPNIIGVCIHRPWSTTTRDKTDFKTFIKIQVRECSSKTFHPFLICGSSAAIGGCLCLHTMDATFLNCSHKLQRLHTYSDHCGRPSRIPSLDIAWYRWPFPVIPAQGHSVSLDFKFRVTTVTRRVYEVQRSAWIRSLRRDQCVWRLRHT
jgi:hypothetical protein